jgi:hypothetical protein
MIQCKKNKVFNYKQAGNSGGDDRSDDDLGDIIMDIKGV